VLGEVFGLTVRSAAMSGSQFGARVQIPGGGARLKGMTKNLQLSRERRGEARMVDGGGGPRWNAVLAHAVRHIGDGRELDGDLRLRDCRRHRADRCEPAGRCPHGPRARLRAGTCVPYPVWFMRQSGPARSPNTGAAKRLGLHPPPLRRRPRCPPRSPCSRSGANGVDAGHPLSRTSWFPLHAIGFGVDVEQGRGPGGGRAVPQRDRPGGASGPSSRPSTLPTWPRPSAWCARGASTGPAWR